ncbi:MAG: hypothetical protein CMJ20_13315 [Phycisphaeraceae bacterium]|nr:hypothetical protein [Phycisphaeraceae bacterium]
MVVGAGEILDPGMARGFGRQILVYLALLTWETIATQSRDVLVIKVHWQGCDRNSLACAQTDSLWH